MMFQDRTDGGKQLVGQLNSYRKQPNTIVLGLPRGGVVTAAEVAKELLLPFDIIVVRKIPAPMNEEMAIGAVDENGYGFFGEELITILELEKDYLQNKIEEATKEAHRRLELYRSNRPPLDLKGKAVILVDDGIATGYTMLCAIRSARQKGAEKIVVASPVIAFDTLPIIQKNCDEVAAVIMPPHFWAIGEFYNNFDQVEDAQVLDCMRHF